MKKYLSVIFTVISTIWILSSCMFDDGHYDGIYRDIKADIKVSAKYAGAVENENPLEAELFLNGYRVRFLDDLRPIDPFCEDAVFYYALKLKMMARIKLFDSEKGTMAYQDIYNSIMSKDKQEA